MSRPSRWQPQAWLLAAAAARMRKTAPEWADAMLAEAENCPSDRDRLAWAWGCWIASLRASFDAQSAAYRLALAAGLGAIGAYEWSADENLLTVILVSLITLGLAALQPRQAMRSGVLIGVTVAAIVGFEAASGIRPAYEAHTQTLASSLYWLVLLVPALCAAALGARLGRRLRTTLARR